MTFSCFNGHDFFLGERFCLWFIENLDLCRNYGMYKIISYVIMPNHVHLLIAPNADDYNISKLLASIKIPITRRIHYHRSEISDALLQKMIDESPSRIINRFWQRGGGYDRNLQSKQAIMASIQYMHANPVRKGLVNAPEDWKWSSAAFYTGTSDYILKMDNEILLDII